MQIGVETAKAVDQRRVFVIDEDDITRTVLQFMLQDEIETHELATPEAAFAKGADWLKPDLVLLGAALFQSRGPALLAALTEHFAAVRILIVYGADEVEIAAAAFRAGAHGGVGKPLKLETVRQTVDRVLGRAGAPLVRLG